MKQRKASRTIMLAVAIGMLSAATATLMTAGERTAAKPKKSAAKTTKIVIKVPGMT